MRHVTNNPRIFVDRDINPMDEFGIGANMVKAWRYWLQVTGLTTEGAGNNRKQHLTPFGCGWCSRLGLGNLKIYDLCRRGAVFTENS